MTEDRYLTTADALEYLRTAPRTLYRLLASGKIPALRIGHQWRFRKADLDRWAAAQAPPRALARSAAVAATVDIRRVLAVDDDPAVLLMLTRILAVGSYQVETAPDGLAGLARLRSETFDLVITDLKMPGLEGTDLGREAKRLRPGIRVIIITGYPSESTAIDAVNFGLDGYLIKPFRATDLLAAVVRALEPLEASRASAHTKPTIEQPSTGRS